MTTLTTLRAQCRLVLASTTDWPNATIDGFIQDAIRFHSAQFPRRWRYTLSLTTGTQGYPLPGAHGFHGVVAVEYPTGESPQSFLKRADEWDDEFQDKEDVYALRGIADTTAIESQTSQAYIQFAETVTTSETAVIEYLGNHPIPTAGDDDAQITVPMHHWEALVAFVEFRAHWELESDEAVGVTASSIVLSQLGENARRAWNRYKEICNALARQEASSHTIDWTSDHDTMKRVY